MTARSTASASALAFAGVMFLLYPALRPWNDESTPAGAQASMASAVWVVSHLCAMLGFMAVPLGVRGLSRLGVLLTWAGAGLTLPYYGAEAFGLHGAARAGVPDLVALAEHVRFSPVAVATFGVGLMALATGAVVIVGAVWRSNLPRWSPVLFAFGLVSFIPQFYLPAPLRIAHGVVLAVGCWWLAAARWQRRGASSPREPLTVG
jgi:hypothetical protein